MLYDLWGYLGWRFRFFCGALQDNSAPAGNTRTPMSVVYGAAGSFPQMAPLMRVTASHPFQSRHAALNLACRDFRFINTFCRKNPPKTIKTLSILMQNFMHCLTYCRSSFVALSTQHTILDGLLMYNRSRNYLLLGTFTLERASDGKEKMIQMIICTSPFS